MDTLLSAMIPTLVVLHLVVAPYTKVEESFNMQATHDMLAYDIFRRDAREYLSAHYDHFDFPGAVPRTFTGSLLLSRLGAPLITAVGFQYAQFIVRAVLGLASSAALLYFKHRIGLAFGKPTARWFTVLQASQFHVIFYASRLLPNMLAFPLTTMALAQLIPHPDSKKQGERYVTAIAWLTIATAVFRSELAILMVTVTLYGWLVHRASLPRIIKLFSVSFVLSLLLSLPCDSYFWQKPLWPELWGFYYNAVLGSSSDWGVSPWHYYFTSALPKILTNPLTSTILIPFALWNSGTARQTRALVVPSLLFVAIYSIQPHKEARFIFYVAPPLTAAAALGANYIFSRRKKSYLFMAASQIIAGSVLVSFAISTAMLLISSLNYPGGEALSELKTLVTSLSSPEIQTAAVHTDVLSCMTGVTLFGQHPYWPGEHGSAHETVLLTFDKTEDEITLRNPLFWERFDYALAEDPGKPLGRWETIGVVEGFAGIEVLKPGKPVRNEDIEAAQQQQRVLGRGALVKRIRSFVREKTGGWWVGPRMEPRVYILRKSRESEAK
ncbi:glycosyltransferase family 22 protein [Nemania sp. FL0916]|nr:glycosyltransferase family 22 protein [Nemania sp. FL0916]